MTARIRTRSTSFAKEAAPPRAAHDTLALKVVYYAIAGILPATRNARTHSPKQLQQIAASISRFGFVNPVLIDSEHRIVAGHGRLEAAKMLGLVEVPTVCLAHMSQSELRAYRLADNRLAELGGWDEELLALELGELMSLQEGFEVELTGFDTVKIDQIISSAAETAGDGEDLAPEPKARAVTREGEIWLLGSHRLLCGDARNLQQLHVLMSGKPAQVVFTDPPYNVPVNGHVSGLGKQQHREFAMACGEMTSAEFAAFLTCICKNLAAVSADGAIHFVCMDWRHMGELLTAGEEAYTELKNLVVWNKDNAGMGAFYRSQHELIFAFKKGAGKHINNFGLGENGRYRTNIWAYAGANTFRRGRAEELALHPTMKPVAMVMDAIKDCSHRGGIVLDIFGGSGTTLMAAERTGRRGYLMEIDPLYVDVTIRRWEALTGQAAKLAGSELTFDGVSAERLGVFAAAEMCHA